MVRHYRFQDLMYRLLSNTYDVVEMEDGDFVFIPQMYRGKTLMRRARK